MLRIAHDVFDMLQRWIKHRMVLMESACSAYKKQGNASALCSKSKVCILRDLVCCVQAELDTRGLAAIHADSAKDI